MIDRAREDGTNVRDSAGAAASITLAPCGTIEGSQDLTTSNVIAGWAWDRLRPNVPLHVDIYDGDRLLAHIAAATYRKDLRDAGIGDGRHAFFFPLAAHRWGRTRRHMTVRVAGTPILLPDGATGAVPRPISRQDRYRPPPIPQFSLPPFARWCYYTVAKTLLRPFPRPIWRLPSALLAAVRVLRDAEGKRLDRSLLSALDLPVTFVTRWRMHWTRSYQRQADLLLSLQTARMTPEWACRQVQGNASLPPEGAILLTIHHANRRLGMLVLSRHLTPLGSFAPLPRDAAAFNMLDPTLQRHLQETWPARTRIFGDRLFVGPYAGRRALQLLRSGGYVIIEADAITPGRTGSALLGHALALPDGAAWLAGSSGKPIIPFMVVPDGKRWRLWIGQRVAPTRQGVLEGITRCIRQSPGSWERSIAMMWREAPVCHSGDGPEGT